jgi:hypothetical protein
MVEIWPKFSIRFFFPQKQIIKKFHILKDILVRKVQNGRYIQNGQSTKKFLTFFFVY